MNSFEIFERALKLRNEAHYISASRVTRVMPLTQRANDWVANDRYYPINPISVKPKRDWCKIALAIYFATDIIAAAALAFSVAYHW